MIYTWSRRLSQPFLLRYKHRANKDFVNNYIFYTGYYHLTLFGVKYKVFVRILEFYFIGVGIYSQYRHQSDIHV